MQMLPHPQKILPCQRPMFPGYGGFVTGYWVAKMRIETKQKQMKIGSLLINFSTFQTEREKNMLKEQAPTKVQYSAKFYGKSNDDITNDDFAVLSYI